MPIPNINQSRHLHFNKKNQAMPDHYSGRKRRRSRSPMPSRGSRERRPDQRRTERSRSRDRHRHQIRSKSRDRDHRRGGRSRSRERSRDRPHAGGYTGRGGVRSGEYRDIRSSRDALNQNVRPSNSSSRPDPGKDSTRRRLISDTAASVIRDHMPLETPVPHSTVESSIMMNDSFEQQEIVDDVVIDEAALENIEKFLEGGDEETEAMKLAEDRRKRREEIMRKHQSSSATASSVTDYVPAITGTSTVNMKNIHMSDESNTDFLQHIGGPASFDACAIGATLEMEKSEADAFQAEQDAVKEEALRTEPHAFDIFSASPSDQEMAKAGVLPKRASNGLLKTSALGDEGGSHLQSNYDDTDGYYKLTIGEVIAGRYRTQGVVGKGVFSTVLKCVDLVTEGTVAIKMIRNNDVMRKAAEKELSILTLLSTRDPENKKYCVCMLGHLDYRNHTTFVFESLQMNLRDALKKFGKNVGINVTAIRMYGRQLFVALKYLSDLQIVHADIKLDNILVSEDLKQVKICDFGSAFLETDPDRDPTPYLVSRFYRAPEIILGLHYDRMVDMFSVGTCLYELFTGHVMLPGRTNNDMLRLMQAFKGKLPNKILKNHLRSYEKMGLDTHFDNDLKFKQWDQDPVTGKPVLRLVDILQPTKDLSAILLSSKVLLLPSHLLVLLMSFLPTGWCR